MKIGGYEIGGRILAPMAGYTDMAFRELCRGFGAGLTVTEMVSVRGLVRGNAATDMLTATSDAEAPSCVQLFGCEPSDFYRAVRLLTCDIIDINMGCPMPKITKNGDGAALLLDPKRAGDIVRAAVEASDGRPITVKTRACYSDGDGRGMELARAVATGGAAALTVHGRSAEQRYSGVSDVSLVRGIKAAVDIPVIYNGDVDGENIGALEAEFGAVAIGRCAIKSPHIFGGAEISPSELARRHLALLQKYFDERYTVFQSRKFFAHYFRGVDGGRAVRTAANEGGLSDIFRALDAFDRLDKNHM